MWHTGLSQWRSLFVDSRRLIAQSQNRNRMCEKRLSCPALPSGWVLCISIQWLRLKACHVVCDKCTSGGICSLQQIWVTGSVMWVVASGASLKFGVQGASATNWFSRVNGARDNRIRLYLITYPANNYHEFKSEILPKWMAKIFYSQFECLYMISLITNCEIQLNGKNPHLAKLQISDLHLIIVWNTPSSSPRKN